MANGVSDFFFSPASLGGAVGEFHHGLSTVPLLALKPTVSPATCASTPQNFTAPVLPSGLPVRFRIVLGVMNIDEWPTSLIGTLACTTTPVRMRLFSLVWPSR